jgi:hypothetical protein
MRKKYRLEHDESPKKIPKKIPTIDIVLYVVGGLLIVGTAIALIVHFSKKPSPSGGAPAPPPGPPPSGCHPPCDNSSGEYCAPAPSKNIEYFGEDDTSGTGKCTLCPATSSNSNAGQCVSNDNKCITCKEYSTALGTIDDDGRFEDEGQMYGYRGGAGNINNWKGFEGAEKGIPGLCKYVCGCNVNTDCNNTGEVCYDNRCVQGFFGCDKGKNWGCYTTQGGNDCVSGGANCKNIVEKNQNPNSLSGVRWYNQGQMLTRNVLKHGNPPSTPLPAALPIPLLLFKDFYWGCRDDNASEGCVDTDVNQSPCVSHSTCGEKGKGTIQTNLKGDWKNSKRAV